MENNNPNLTNVFGVTSLIDDLATMYNELRDGTIKNSDAKHRSEVARTLLSAANLKLLYVKYSKSNEKIDFLEK